MARRKRTSRNVPAKGRLREFADKLWGKAVADDWAWKCAVCGKPGTDPHHLIPRQHQKTRYMLRNGIWLCSHCHNWDADIAPHQNAAGWLQWLHEHHEELGIWYTNMTATNEYRQFDGRLTPGYYCDTIRGFQEYVDPDEYVRIVGKRFAAWLEKTEELSGA